jgi:hypothetical protein
MIQLSLRKFILKENLNFEDQKILFGRLQAEKV